eukprot:SAG11_NODE_9682_length_890_cov_0.891277_2_plen_229_part_01
MDAPRSQKYRSSRTTRTIAAGAFQCFHWRCAPCRSDFTAFLRQLITTMVRGFALLALSTVHLATAAAGPPAPPPLECGMRKLALARAEAMQPWRDHAATFDALELATLCGLPPPPPLSAPAASHRHKQQSAPLSAAAAVFHVDAVAGSDLAAGTAAAPFRSLVRALAAARAARAASPDQTAPPPPIVLSAGVHFLNETIVLTPADSGQVITAAAGGQAAWLSGGVEIKA